MLCLVSSVLIAMSSSQYLIIDPPCPVPGTCPHGGGSFGHAVKLCDFDGDGISDIAVGAPGEGAVYVFFGPQFTNYQAMTAGVLYPMNTCPPGNFVDYYGASIDAAPLDAIPGDELIIGAPKSSVGNLPYCGLVHVVGVQALSTLGTDSPISRGEMGDSVAVGDFDDDGTLDIAAGVRRAPVGGLIAGEVRIFVNGLSASMFLSNPDPVQNGVFGAVLEAADGDGDGKIDLFVSAQGNSPNGFMLAGAVYYYQTPSMQLSVILDPSPVSGDDVRFGKTMACRDQILLVGAPRKDEASSGTLDVGSGFLYDTFPFSSGQALVDPMGVFNELLGFNVQIADVIGDATHDYLVIANGTNETLVFDGSMPGNPPVYISSPPGSDYWSPGVDHGQLRAGNKEEIIFGDSRFGSGCEGRVVIWLPSNA